MQPYGIKIRFQSECSAGEARCPPRYTLKVARRRPVPDSFRAVIDKWLKED